MTKPTTALAELKKKVAEQKDSSRFRVRVGMATCGVSAGADKVYDAFLNAVTQFGLGNVDVISTGCVGRCDLEPMAEVTRGAEPPVLYIRLNPKKVDRIVREHLAEGRVVEDYAE